MASPNMRRSSPIMRHFRFMHLKGSFLQKISSSFFDLADQIDNQLPDGPEKSVALRKLLEAKDAAVRSAVEAEEDEMNTRGYLYPEE